MEVDIYRLSWTREQEKAFENSLATHSEDCSNRWEKIVMDVPGKTVEEVMYHYELLIEDVTNIESGQVPIPCYLSSLENCEQANDGSTSKKRGQSHGDLGNCGKASRSDHERKRGIAWTEDEHRLFLLGLDKYGKGDWRSISRNFVISRTPTQVASHAQKYFNRLNSMNKERRRNSIHDITSAGNADSSGPNVAVTDQSNGPVATIGKPIKQPPQPSGGHPGVGTYGRTTIGRPLGNPLISAVGTPINLPIAGTAHLAFGLRPPISGTVAPGALVNTPPVKYSLPPTQSDRW